MEIQVTFSYHGKAYSGELSEIFGAGGLSYHLRMFKNKPEPGKYYIGSLRIMKDEFGMCKLGFRESVLSQIIERFVMEICNKYFLFLL